MRKIVFILCALILCATLSLSAQEGGGRRRGGRRMDPEEMVKRELAELKTELKLTEEQEPKVEKILKERFSAFQRPKEGERPDFEAMRAKMEELQENMKKEMKKILNGKQFKKWERIQEEREARMHERRGQGGFGGGQNR